MNYRLIWIVMAGLAFASATANADNHTHTTTLSSGQVFHFVVSGTVTAATSHNLTIRRVHDIVRPYHTVICSVMDGGASVEYHPGRMEFQFAKKAEIVMSCRVVVGSEVKDALDRWIPFVSTIIPGMSLPEKRRLMRDHLSDLTKEEYELMLNALDNQDLQDNLWTSLKTEYPSYATEGFVSALSGVDMAEILRTYEGTVNFRAADAVETWKWNSFGTDSYGQGFGSGMGIGGY